MKRTITVGNLNCIFIGEKIKYDLLDRWNEYVKNIFVDNYSMGLKPQRLFKHINVTSIKNDPVIVGRFVKNTLLRVEQVLIEDQLEPRDDSYESAPSSVFIYLLKNHSLIYLRENPGAPSIRSFRKFIEISINKERKQYISNLSNGKSAEEKLKIVENNPPLIASYIPLPMFSSLDEEFSKLIKISKVKIRHYYQNANLDIKSWISSDNAILNALKAPKIDHTITSVIDIEGAKEFIEDIAKANNSEFTVEGTSEDGEMTISNQGIQYTSYINNFEPNDEILNVAEKVYSIYELDKTRGVIPDVRAKNSDEQIKKVFRNE